MNQYALALIIVLAALVVFSLITIVAVKRVSKSKGNAAKDEAALEKVSKGITYADAIATAISPFLPGIANSTIATVLNIGQKSVVSAEATYKAAISTDENAADTRKVAATSLAKSGLALEGVKETTEIDKLIDTVIPLLVLALPKTHSAADSKVTAPADSAPQTATQAASGAVASGTTGAA